MIKNKPKLDYYYEKQNEIKIGTELANLFLSISGQCVVNMGHCSTAFAVPLLGTKPSWF